MIRSYEDFVEALLQCGFCMGGSNPEGIFTLIPWDWREEPPEGSPVRWHTGDPQTDPWEWYSRIVTERRDIACAKLFFKKTGYLTRAWYPYFLAVRRRGRGLEEEYADGTVSRLEKQVYDCVSAGPIAYHNLKAALDDTGKEQSRLERAVTSLQSRMYITSCGKEQKISQAGLPYGWPSVVFCTTEAFMGEDVFEKAAQIAEQEAIEAIEGQVYRLNPQAVPKAVHTFIHG